jgi:two-component sensor histidine kinase
MFSFADMYRSYTVEIKRIDQYINQIQKSHVPFLISSLWLTDYALVEKQIESIIRFPYIRQVKIETQEGPVFTAGADYSGKVHLYTQPLHYTYKNQNVPLGKMIIAVDQKQLERTVIKQQFTEVIGHLAAALITAVLMSILFHHMVGKHLKDLTQKLKTDHPDRFGTPFALNRKRSGDELDLLTASLNGLRMNLKIHIDEKNLLLHEVHHRIKNNMTTVQGLLLLQEEKSQSREAALVLREAQGRLQSMTTLYDKLYRTPINRDVSAREYFPDLLREITDTYTTAITITLKEKIEDIILPVHLLSILGIILNELISNSIKHSFPGAQSGTISVTLGRKAPETAELVYSDDGVPIPESILEGGSQGLGMTIITMLGAQIGNVQYSRERKNKITLTFTLV